MEGGREGVRMTSEWVGGWVGGWMSKKCVLVYVYMCIWQHCFHILHKGCSVQCT